MELRRLRYFACIAAEGSLGKASRALGIAQPALGRQIQLLETELGVKLFQRVARGMQLTEEGEYLRDALEHPLGLIDMALHNVRSYSSRIEATLRLGLPPVISQLMGMRLLLQLRAELPNLKLHLCEDDSPSLAGQLSRGLLDAAILADIIPDRHCFHGEVLAEPLLLAGKPDAPALQQRTVPFRMLAQLPLILPGPQSPLRTRLLKMAANADIQINAGMEIDSACLAREAAAAGMGYTILPEIALRAETLPGKLAAVPIVEPIPQQVIYWAVQPHWRVPRSLYNIVERIIFTQWHAAVANGEWPAAWKMDLSRLSLPLGTNGL
jgi:LysR family transcriptional regulator, nitrogen assimilation regulatory protein